MGVWERLFRSLFRVCLLRFGVVVFGGRGIWESGSLGVLGVVGVCFMEDRGLGVCPLRFRVCVFGVFEAWEFWV